MLSRIHVAYDAWKEAEQKAQFTERALTLAWAAYDMAQGERPSEAFTAQAEMLRAAADERLRDAIKANGFIEHRATRK